ncbi:keratin, type I cytoskeletal 18-like [Ursus americanus]|uniref:keratin, type I cytoskeletal 18-like n=1 Tax=Ursus americanus TaxID=9643 RepID=UPI001E67B5B1|nr:keratin, type I cytoskeletal 18-like [Ursus americanus]
MDNACLATEDFRVKYETELAVHQSVDNDICGLCKSLKTSVSLSCSWRWKLTLKVELFFMNKNHEEEVKGLQTQTPNSRLTMELDAPNLRTSARSWWTSRPSMTSWLRRTKRSWTSTRLASRLRKAPQ